MAWPEGLWGRAGGLLMAYGRMTHSTLAEQLEEAQRLMRESAENTRRADLERDSQ